MDVRQITNKLTVGYRGQNGLYGQTSTVLVKGTFTKESDGEKIAGKTAIGMGRIGD